MPKLLRLKPKLCSTSKCARVVLLGWGTVNSIAKKYATTAGTNHEAVTFDFTSGVDEGTWNDVTEGSRVYMAIQANASITPGTVAVCALWEWDYSTI